MEQQKTDTTPAIGTKRRTDLKEKDREKEKEQEKGRDRETV